VSYHNVQELVDIKLSKVICNDACSLMNIIITVMHRRMFKKGDIMYIITKTECVEAMLRK